MKHTPVVGSRFRLEAWEWFVQEVQATAFKATEVGDYGDGRYIWFYTKDADSLDWILPSPTINKNKIDLTYNEMDKEWYCDACHHVVQVKEFEKITISQEAEEKIEKWSDNFYSEFADRRWIDIISLKSFIRSMVEKK